MWTSFNILALSETWLKDDANLLNSVQIPGYKFSYKNRNERTGGGDDSYIKDSIEYQVCHDLSKIDESIDTLRSIGNSTWNTTIIITSHEYRLLETISCT